MEVFQLVAAKLDPLAPNERGRFAIPQLEVELGIWQGAYEDFDLPWLRWWDAQGQLLRTGREEAEQLRERLLRLEKDRE